MNIKDFIFAILIAMGVVYIFEHTPQLIRDYADQQAIMSTRDIVVSVLFGIGTLFLLYENYKLTRKKIKGENINIYELRYNSLLVCVLIAVILDKVGF